MTLSPAPRQRARASVLVAATSLLMLPLTMSTAAAAVAPAASTGPQLVANGSFESGTTGWKTNTADTRLATVAGGPAGSSFARLSADAGTTIVLNDRDNTVTSASAGDTYQVSAYVRTDQPSASGQLRVREAGAGDVVTHAAEFFLRDQSWTKVELDVQVQNDGADLDLNVLTWDAAAGRHLDVDGVSLVETGVTAPTPVPTPPPTPTTPTTPTTPGTTPGTTPATPTVAGRLNNGCGYSLRGIPACGAYLGGAIGGNDDPAALEQEMGKRLGVRRTYFQPHHQDYAVSTARADLALGRLPWISFKLPHTWKDMAAGRGDAWAKDIAQRLSKLPGPVWLAFHHEPENDSQAIEDWTAMQERLGPIVRANADNVAFSVILMGWHQFYGADKFELDRMWPKTKVDVAGFDIYNFQGAPSNGKIMTTPQNLRKLYFDRLEAWSDKVDIPWALAETGYTNMAAEKHPKWVRRTFRKMKKTGGIAFSYFNSPLNSDADWTLTMKSKQEDFARALRHSARLPEHR